MCSVKKPVPDVVRYLEHSGFPLEGTQWQVKRDDRFWSVIEQLRAWVFLSRSEQRWYWRDEDR